MSIVEFLRSYLRQMHDAYDEAIADLTPEQLHWRANDNGCPIAFILWHYVRTEDNIIRFVLQRKQTVWLEGGWDQKFGLDRIAQGTGMPLQEAQNLRINSKEGFQEYMKGVCKATDEFLAGIDDAYLEQKITVKPLGEMPVLNALGTMCLTHGFSHLGEIQHLRGLQGLKGMPV